MIKYSTVGYDGSRIRSESQSRKCSSVMDSAASFLDHRGGLHEAALRMLERVAVALDELTHHVVGGAFVAVRQRVVAHET
jgi:hypothetical protein